MEKADAIEASGMTPLDFMIEVMRNRSNSAEMRLEAAKSAAPYVHARLHAAEITEPQDDLADEEDIVGRIEAILAANPELKKLIAGIENERDRGGKVVALHPDREPAGPVERTIAQSILLRADEVIQRVEPCRLGGAS